VETEDVAAELQKHEAICAERWKTVFNQLQAIEQRSAKRFDGVDESITRIETILIGAAGTAIVTMGGIIYAMLNLH
tara:strand:- start:1050 stop:1277 length:228 start_codon:yes stop_codon:yes gene_type:complete